MVSMMALVELAITCETMLRSIPICALRHQGHGIQNAIPTIYKGREFAADGGLMSYGDNGQIIWRLVGVYTGRILKGEKPADLPVQKTTKAELIINMKTAKALG